MKSFIEELYYGNIAPQNSGFEDDESVQHELRTISENEDWPAESCSKKVCNHPVEKQIIGMSTPCWMSASRPHPLFSA